MKSVLTVREGETVYDMAWLPSMTSADPATCVFMSTSRDNPVHAWDAFTGQPRASYCAYTDAEELESGADSPKSLTLPSAMSVCDISCSFLSIMSFESWCVLHRYFSSIRCVASLLFRVWSLVLVCMFWYAFQSVTYLSNLSLCLSSSGRLSNCLCKQEPFYQPISKES